MIFIQKMSKQLKDQLKTTHRTVASWHVHSIFKNGFNLMNDKQLLFIGTDKNGELPFAMHLTARDTKSLVKRIKVGDLFYYHPKNDQLTFNETILSFDYCYYYNSVLVSQPKISLTQMAVVLGEAEKVTEQNGFKQFVPLSLETPTYDAVFIKSMEGLFSNEEGVLKKVCVTS